MQKKLSAKDKKNPADVGHKSSSIKIDTEDTVRENPISKDYLADGENEGDEEDEEDKKEEEQCLVNA